MGCSLTSIVVTITGISVLMVGSLMGILLTLSGVSVLMVGS